MIGLSFFASEHRAVTMTAPAAGHDVMEVIMRSLLGRVRAASGEAALTWPGTPEAVARGKVGACLVVRWADAGGMD